jgi:hypothetical protein
VAYRNLGSSAYTGAVIDTQVGAIQSIITYGGGTVGSTSIVSLPNGWFYFRINNCVLDTTSTLLYTDFRNLTSDSTYATTGSNNVTGDGVNGTGLYGIDVEAGTFATSTILTDASTLTRTADQLYTTNFPWFNPAAGTIYARAIFEAVDPSSSQRLLSFHDGVIDNNLLELGGSTTYLNTRVNSGGSVIFNPNTLSNSTNNTVYKTALSYANANYATVTNGGTVSTQASGSLPTGINALDLGSDIGRFYLNGWLQEFRYWNYNQTASQIQNLTT